MIENRNVNIITDADGKKLVLINDIRFKAKVRDDWTAVEEYLKEYIGDFYEIEETSEKISLPACDKGFFTMFAHTHITVLIREHEREAHLRGNF